MEIVPYTVARARYVRPADPTNPFTKDNDRDYRIGGDLKYRLTSNLTLNAAVNPDFGQVEVDPAVVNLSAFETFFQERRPFFIENQSNFGFGSFNCYFCSNVSNLQMFYTRRIGRSPQLFPAGTYVDQPENATILAAAKITGRTANNYLVGVLDAVTRRENASVIVQNPSGRDQFEREVEPLTNYFVFRPRKEFQGGAYSLGGIVTAVDRFTDDSLALFRLPKNARSVGLDWFASRDNRTYSFMGQLALSGIHGSATSIDRLQRSSARYFQRPDRENGDNGFFSDRYDPTADNLRGYAGYARVAKDAGVWLWESMINYRSPGFEVNDISFLSKSDYVWMNTNVARSIVKPGPIYRNYFAVLSAQQELNYDGYLTDRQFAAGIFGQLRNFWQANAFVIRTPESYDDRATRGGPQVKRYGYRYYQTFIATDARKNLLFYKPELYSARARGRQLQHQPERDLQAVVKRPAVPRTFIQQDMERRPVRHFWPRFDEHCILRTAVRVRRPRAAVAVHEHPGERHVHTQPDARGVRPAADRERRLRQVPYFRRAEPVGASRPDAERDNVDR